MAKQYNIPNLPKDYSDASQIEKWMSGIQKLFQSKNDADNKKEIEIEDSINSSACTEDAVKDILNASGSAPIYACRAWVNFNGSVSSANMIKSSGNISSITDIDVGRYNINFITAMEDNYPCIAISIGNDSGSTTSGSWAQRIAALTSTYVTLYIARNDTGAFADGSIVSVTVFR